MRSFQQPAESKPLQTVAELPPQAHVYTRSEHNISRTLISDEALKVLYRLRKEGYESFLVGGCVRDLLLGREPKDFDVATDAHPEQVKNVFRNCRLIGRRFRLAHVHFGNQIIEVATFRALNRDSDDGDREEGHNGRILRDNIYGNIEEDAFRRDFTVNALYYNIKDFSVVDYVGGMEDHRAGVLRLIGDPEQRYREDPVRMLRAVRFAVKLGFTIHPTCAEPIPRLAPLLQGIPAARLYDEVLKLLLTGYSVQTFEMLRHYGLFGELFPETDSCLNQEPEGFPLVFLAKALENTDARYQQNLTIAPYFLFACLLWEPVRQLAAKKIQQGENEFFAFQEAASEVLSRQVRHVAITRAVSLTMRDVWSMQPRLEHSKGGRAYKLLEHPRFRAGFDLLTLRAATGEADPAIAEWWKQFQAGSDQDRKALIKGGVANATTTGSPVAKKRRHHRRGPRKPKAPDHAN